MMKIYLLLISVWGYNGTHWEYTGNQYVMKNAFTFEECQALINEDNWKRHENNVFYTMQFDCVLENSY